MKVRDGAAVARAPETGARARRSGLRAVGLPALMLLALASSACSAATDTPGQGTAGAAPLPHLQEGALASGDRAPEALAGARPLVVDTDLGADDLLALAHLLQQPDFEVLAVTVSGTGLVHCDAGVDLAADLVTAITGRAVPVACGREDSTSGRPFPEGWRDATDQRSGLPRSDIGRPTTERPAAELMATTLRGSKAPVTILVLGPMTNLADAMTLDSSLVGRIAAVHAMAGALDVPGNGGLEHDTSGDAEWNVLADPASFAAVVESGAPVTLVPLDATHAVPAGGELVATVTAALRESTSTAAAIVAQLLTGSASLTDPAMAWWDALATVALTSPDVVSAREQVRLEVVLEGESTGELRRSATGGTVDVVTKIDPDRFADAAIAGL